MLKLLATLGTVFVLLTACKGTQKITETTDPAPKEILPIRYNDSISTYQEYASKMIQKIEDISSYSNPITQHFKKHLSKSALKTASFEERRKNIYIEFTLGKYQQITSIATNANHTKLDKQLKKAFKKLSFESLKIDHFHPKYKYTLVIIQEINGKPQIKCNKKAIGYIPPIYQECKEENNYSGLNRCNYMYITHYLYNQVDISLVTSLDIDNNHQIFLKFIVDNMGNVIAAKVESQNKDFLESYYNAIMALPKAIQPAKLNGVNFYYGYNFPTSITNIIRNNNEFKKFYYQKRFETTNIKDLIKEFISITYQKKRNKKIYKVGF